MINCAVHVSILHFVKLDLECRCCRYKERINNMSINPVKTKCMLIGSKHRLKRQSTLSLQIDSHFINNVSSQKVIGYGYSR